MESYRELLLGKAPGGIKSVISIASVGRGGRVERYDVVIIGTGAGGARCCTPGTHRQADPRPRCGPVRAPEKDNWSTRRSTWRRSTTRGRLEGQGGARPPPHTNYFVGGNTKFYGAALFRMRKEDFGELRHHGGVSPAWPLSYDDFEPYYAEAEGALSTSTAPGEDPTSPGRGASLPSPAVSHEPRIQKFSDDVAGLGYKPFHTPLA